MAVTVLKDELARAMKNVRALTGQRVMVGIPEDTTTRDDKSGITNAALGYIHTYGAPSRNIPARPFLVPGVEAEKDKITDILKGATLKALDMPGDKRGRGATADVTMSDRTRGHPIVIMSTEAQRGETPPQLAFVEQALNAVGIVASTAVKKYIVKGISPGLKDSTLENRARRNSPIGKAAQEELNFREAHPNAGLSMTQTTPLIDTGKLLASITYVIRKKSWRKWSTLSTSFYRVSFKTRSSLMERRLMCRPEPPSIRSLPPLRVSVLLFRQRRRCSTVLTAHDTRRRSTSIRHGR